MTAATPYGPRFRAEFGADGGGDFRLDLSLAGYSGAVTDLPGIDAEGTAVAWSVASGSPAGPLAPLAECVLQASLHDTAPGTLSELASLADGAVRADLYTLSGGAPFLHCYAGYLEPETFVEVPGEIDAVRLTFQDGWGLALGSRLVVDPSAGGYDAEATTAFLDTFRGPLAELGGAAGSPARLVSRVGILPDQGAGDPLAELFTRAGAWVDADDAAAYEAAALRTLAARLNCRVFQSPGLVSEGGVRYVVQQRSLLAYDAAAVPSRVYALSGGAALSSTTDNLLVDAETWGWVRGARRERVVPVASVDVEYDYGRALDSLVANASFEDAGTGGATTAAHWSLSGADPSAPPLGATYARRVAVPADGYGGTPSAPGPLEPTYGDGYALEITDDGGLGFARPTAAQGGYAVVPREDGSAVRVDLQAFFQPAGNFTAAHQTSPSRLKVMVDAPGGTVSVHRAEVTARADVLSGDEVRLPVAAVLSGFGGAVAGSPVALTGTVVRFEGQNLAAERVVSRLTLTRDLVVGDTSAVGDLDEDIVSGAVAPVLFFAPGEDGVDLHDLAPSLLGAAGVSLSGDAPAVAVDGTDVEGPLRVWVEGAKVDPAPAEASRSRETWYVGRIDVAPRAGDADGRRRSVTGQVDRVSVDGPGLEAVLPTSDGALRVGDGPLPDFPGSILVDASGTLIPTSQGTATAWGNAAEPGYTASGVGEATARDAVRQLAGSSGPLRRWSGVLVMEGGAVFEPEKAYALPFADEGAAAPGRYWWDASATWYPALSRTALDATELRLDDPALVYERELLT